MDQRAVILNMVSLFAVLFLITSATCFGRYALLLRKFIRGHISERRYQMRKRNSRRLCNGMFWAIVLVTVIVGGAMEFGQLAVFLKE